VIVKHLVSLARRFGAEAVAHGCTGKGNDQVRFEVGTRSIAPDLDILAPARNWGMNREECVAYAKRHEIPVEATKEKIYSIDENLWGRAIECGEMEDPWARPPDDAYVLTRPTASEPTEIVVGFEQGTPVSVDGKELALDALIGEVASLVGSYGWGRLDMVENRRVGIKSRETYECPAALALLLAHRDLEDLTLERDLAHEKLRMEIRWAELVYDGMWFSPLKDALDSFFESSQKHVTGEVRLSLVPGAVGSDGEQLPGACYVTGRRSPVSLYEHDLATYDAGDSFRHEDAEGFVRLWGLGVATWAARQGGGAGGAPNSPSNPK
jgi:argininosuccinate synthase